MSEKAFLSPFDALITNSLSTFITTPPIMAIIILVRKNRLFVAQKAKILLKFLINLLYNKIMNKYILF